MFFILFPPIPLGPFAFFQAELASLLNAAASLPHPVIPHGSWEQKGKGLWWVWRTQRSPWTVSISIFRRENIRNINSEHVIRDFSFNHRAVPGMLLCRSCHLKNLPQALWECVQDSTKLLAKHNTMDLHPNLKHS